MQRILGAIILLTVATPTFAQRVSRAYPPEMPGSRTETYKTVGDVKLNVYIYSPENHKPSDRRAAIVFFFGGGWRAGSPTQFMNHSKYLASRGMVAMCADYRVSSRHETKAISCVRDAKSAIRWTRKNARRLGIDPDRIVAAGGSAGGHLAACTGVISGLDETDEDTSVSSRPNAMALFNPAAVLAPVKGKPEFTEERLKSLQDRMGMKPEALSPIHHVDAGDPPAVVFHGKADTTVAYWTAEAFAEAMKTAGNRCKLHAYEGQRHGFFNYGRSNNKFYLQTVEELDKFLASLGYLEGPPTIGPVE